MSASEPGVTYPFRIQVELDGRIDRLSRIRVSDGRNRPLAAADGELQCDLPPGLYPVRVRRGELIADVVLRHGPEAPVDRVIAAPQRRSALPTSDSSTAAHYYREPAQTWSAADTGSGPLSITGAGDDPRLFIFVRASSREAAAGVWVGNGLELCDRDGAILSLFGEEHTQADAADGWLAFSRRLPPGFYRLRWMDPSGSRAIALTLFDDWDTQVYVPFDGHPQVERASILLLNCGVPFDPNSGYAQSTDMGLLGLRQGRDLLPGAMRRELFNGNFRDPMLGLIGAHLLLMAPESSPDNLHIVLDNLRYNLLGDVPDVRALQWRAWQRLGGNRPPQEPFVEPPMLRAGLRAVIDADADLGGLIPADGILSWISRFQRADSAWTTWSPPVQTHAKPRPEHTARPYLLPNNRDVVFLDTVEDFDLSSDSMAPRREVASRNARMEAVFDALRSEAPRMMTGLPGFRVGRPVDGLRRHLDRLDLDSIVTKSLAPAAEATPLGPSLSVALSEDPAAPAEGGAPDWIDSLVKEALDSACRRVLDIDIPALARAANLPRAVIEERIAALRDQPWESTRSPGASSAG
ncbi:hypothetical protein [Rhabdochromatium marinum]|uniref:hypothetical protein n=1 Tax=Rhabdochromatium marinum TaxID=48729 RepID=UPI001908CC28|nr:hypothetical protein [Rhabdochromatium marinum]MBK1649834.1 hypothetical protein [Rhabdochromatium marinum]